MGRRKGKRDPRPEHADAPVDERSPEDEGQDAERGTTPLFPPPGASRLSMETRLLPVAVQPGEIEGLAREAQVAFEDWELKKAGMVAAAFDHRKLVKEALAKLHAAMESLKTGRRMTEVACEQLLDLERRLVYVVRKDRAEDDPERVVERRLAEDSELQYPLPVGAPDEPPPLKCGHCGGPHLSGNCAVGVAPPGDPAEALAEG